MVLVILMTTSTYVWSDHLSAASDIWSPFFMKLNNRYTGIGVDILNEVVKRTGDTLEIKQIPTKRAEYMLKNSYLDIVVLDSPLWSDSKEMDSFVFSDELMSVKEYVYFLNEDYVNVKSPLELKGKEVSVLAGYYYPAFEQAFNSGMIKKREVVTEPSLLKMLAQGRTDAIFMDSIAFDYTILKMKYNQSTFRVGLQISDSPLAFKISKNKSSILPRFNKAIMSMKKDGSIDRIIRKYTK